MSGVQITEYNAHKYNDNYRVEDGDGLNYWMEHNQQEANALAKWLTGTNGKHYYVVPVPKDTVKYAQSIRPAVVRHPLRQEAFADMGVA